MKDILWLVRWGHSLATSVTEGAPNGRRSKGGCAHHPIWPEGRLCEEQAVHRVGQEGSHCSQQRSWL